MNKAEAPYSLSQSIDKKVDKMRNTFKMETTIDYTYWDLNCRHVIHHKKKHNKLEKIFKRKNRRKIKKALDRYTDR